MVKQCSANGCYSVAEVKCKILKGKVGCGKYLCNQHKEGHENLPHLPALCFQCGAPANHQTAVSGISPMSARYGGRKTVIQFCSQACVDLALQGECARCHETKKITTTCTICFKHTCKDCKKCGLKEHPEVLKEVVEGCTPQ